MYVDFRYIVVDYGLETCLTYWGYTLYSVVLLIWHGWAWVRAYIWDGYERKSVFSKENECFSKKSIFFEKVDFFRNQLIFFETNSGNNRKTSKQAE